MSALNYKHLHYFWMVAKTGGVARASERLHLTAQTISGQLSQFEDSIGYRLFNRTGRKLELNDAGRTVFAYADQMFTLAEELEAVIRQGAAPTTLPLRVGVADAVPKTIAYLLLETALKLPEAGRIVCREGKLDSLLADLAIHRLDIVIADSAIPGHINVRGYSHRLGESNTSFFATPALAATCTKKFPHSLDQAPFLMPGEDAAVRPALLRWFEKHNIHPHITGEFDDGALLNAFGEAGTGIFAAPSVVSTHLCRQLGVLEIGQTDQVTEQFFAISVERRLSHPAVLAIQSAARENLIVPSGKST